MAFFKNFSKLSVINLATAGLSLTWIPALLSSLGAEEYGKFVLAATVAVISCSLLYINNWQWLLIQIEKKRLSAVRVSVFNDAAFTVVVVVLASCICMSNSSSTILPEEYLGILASYLIGLSVSHQTIYTAYYRSANKFTQPALVSLFSEAIKSCVIMYSCLAAEDREGTIGLIAALLWFFGVPHLIANVYCTMQLKPWAYKWGRREFSSFFWYNVYLHPKNMSDLLINHFDKIIVTANLGFQSLATYDLLKKCGYALTKILSPAYPLVFRDLVSKSASIELIKSATKNNTAKFLAVGAALYLLFELALFLIPVLARDAVLVEALSAHGTEIRLYVACHLIGFSFCSYHLVLSALGKTKVEFYITVIANLLFVAMFYEATKQSLLLGILVILSQYVGLIVVKVWMTKSLV